MNNWQVGDKVERIWADKGPLINLPDSYYIGQIAKIDKITEDGFIYFRKQYLLSGEMEQGILHVKHFSKSFKLIPEIQENE